MHRVRFLAAALVITACVPLEGEEDELDGGDVVVDAATPVPDAGTPVVDAGIPPAPTDLPKIPTTASLADATCSKGRKVYVMRAVDGDTFELNVYVGTKKEHVRLLGMNTPETHLPEPNPVECYGAEAAAHSIRLVVGQEVCIMYDAAVTAQSDNKDFYGRTLAYMFFGESYARFLNAELLWEGWAKELPITRTAVYTKYFSDLEDAAKRADRGLWGACN